MSTHSFYLTNYFLNYTEHSRKKMIDIVAYFLSAISEGLPDVTLQKIFDRTDPLFALYQTKFNSWKIAKENYQGATLLFTQGFTDVQLKIENIQSKVIGEYTSKSDEYNSIFREGMDVFYSDTYYQRVQHIGFLRDRLAMYVPMASAKTVAADLYTKMMDLRDEQQKKSKTLRNASDDLEECRIDLADMMYGNVGLLMDKYSKTREKIRSFYDLDLLYGHGSKTVATKKTHLDIPVGEYGRLAILITDKKTFEFNNSGNVMLKCYTASTSDAPVPTDALTVDADEVLKAKANTLGAITNTWLIIYNEDLNFSGSIDITETN